MADYYLVLPSLGLAFLVTTVLRDLCAVAAGRGRKPLGRVLARAAVLTLAAWAVAAVIQTARWVPLWNSGESLLGASLRARPGDFKARAGLAELKAEAGHLEDAETLARQAVAQAPAYIHGHYALADALQRKGEDEDALQVFLKAHALRPQDAAPLVLAAHILQAQLERPIEARELYTQALELPWDPEYSRVAALNLGQAYFAVGMVTNAVSVWQKAVEHAPGDPDWHNNLAIGFYRMGDADSALKHAAEAERLGVPLHPNVLRLIDALNAGTAQTNGASPAASGPATQR